MPEDIPPQFTKNPVPPLKKDEGKDKTAPDLQLLKRQLYAREEPQEIIERTKKLSDVAARKGEAYKTPPETESPAAFADVLRQRTRKRQQILKFIGIGALLLVVFALAVWITIWYRAGHQLKNEQLGISVSAPSEFTSGGPIVYTISYENKGKVKWQNVELSFEIPNTFHYESSEPAAGKQGQQYLLKLPDVEAGQTGQALLRGRLVGQLNEAVLAKATLSVSPENSPKSRFSNSANFTTTIRAVPIDAAIEASSTASQGERLLGVVHVRNVSQEEISNVYIAVKAPPGVQLATDDTEFTPGFSALTGSWQVASLKPLEEVKRNIVFYIDGQAGERRSLVIEAGVEEGEEKIVQRELTHVVTVTASELSAQQTFNEAVGDQVVTAGQAMKSVVQYRNTGTVGLRNVIVKVAFEGEGFDPSTLQLQNGAYDPTTRTITWTSATVPGLGFVAPNQGGQVEYSFSMLPTEKFSTAEGQGKDNALVAVASVDSADIATPLGQERKIVSDRTTLSVVTDISLDATAFYDDGRLGLPSSGPLPPKVGETTTYTLRFRLGSTLNDMSDTELVAVLPDGVKYTGKTYQTTGNVDFNDRTGEITWKVPVLLGLTGRTAPPQELHVQVSVTPGENTKGQKIQLLNTIRAAGTDTFVSKQVTTQVTTFPDTETASPQKGKVE